MSVNRIFLAIVFLLLMAFTCLTFVGSGAFGSDELWGIGRVKGVLEIVLVAFLLFNVTQFHKPSAITIIVLLWIPWVLPSVFYRNNELTNLMLGVLDVFLWALVYLFFYAYARGDSQSLRPIVIFFLGLSMTCSILFFLTYRSFNVQRIGQELQMNTSYYPLLTFPWLALVKKPLWRYLAMALIAFAVFYSLKRTSLAGLAVAAITYVAVEYVFVTRRIPIVRLTVPAVLLCLAIVVYYHIDESRGGAFAKRIESIATDEGSGRLKIYADVLDEMAKSSSGDVILGHGHFSSVDYFVTSTHNDFLEVLFDYGVVGLTLYILLHLCLIRDAFRLIRIRSPWASAFATSYVLFFVMSMISHLIVYPSFFVYLTALWGTAEGSMRSRQCATRTRLPPLPYVRHEDALGSTHMPLRGRGI